MRIAGCSAYHSRDLETFVLEVNRPWPLLGHTSSCGSLSVLVLMNWFFGPGLHCPSCLDERPACLPSIVHRPGTFLFLLVFPSSVLRSDLCYLVSQGLCMVIQTLTDAEDHFSWDDMQSYLTLGWKLVEMYASLCWLWVFHSWGLKSLLSLYC